MSTGLNRVMLMGNLGGDPELRFTQKGQPVLHMRLATSEAWVDKNTKELQERTEWHSVTVWGNRGEALSRILTKGDRIIVEGHLETRSYEKEGVKHYATDVVARDVHLTGGRRPAPSMPADLPPAGDEPLAPAPAGKKGKNGAGKKAEPEISEDIPF